MKIALYGRSFPRSFRNTFDLILKYLSDQGVVVYIFNDLIRAANNRKFVNNQENYKEYSFYHELPSDLDFIFSFGGDGTILETLPFFMDKLVPVAGINTGRLGFLADISQEKAINALEAFFDNNYQLEERSLIQLDTSNKLFGEINFALNEFTVHKKDSSSMITIHCYLNGEFLNSYWADGIIVSTPTGSTAYSMSSGGPILSPASRDFIITPIAPHTLTVRPLVLPDDVELSFRIEGRSKSFLATLDHRSKSFKSDLELKVHKAKSKFRILKIENQSFFSTLRTKLMWGLDKRN